LDELLVVGGGEEGVTNYKQPLLLPTTSNIIVLLLQPQGRCEYCLWLEGCLWLEEENTTIQQPMDDAERSRGKWKMSARVSGSEAEL